MTTTLLLLLLGGPLRASSYALLHGSVGITIGLLWSSKVAWLFTIPASALVRTAGIFVSLLTSSLLLRENVLAMILAQVTAMVDQLAAAVGLGSAPDIALIRGFAVGIILLNSLCYLALLHVLYALLLGRGRGGTIFGDTPVAITRMLGTLEPR